MEYEHAIQSGVPTIGNYFSWIFFKFNVIQTFFYTDGHHGSRNPAVEK